MIFRRKKSRGRRLKFAREGKYFVVVAVGVGFAAINTGNNLLYLVLGWLLSVIIASGVLSEQTLRKLVITRTPPPRVQAGKPFLMMVSVQNAKRKIPSFSLQVEDVAQQRLLDKKCFFLKVPAGTTHRTSYRHVVPRRGLVQFDGFRVSTRFPFALFKKTRFVRAESSLVVLPATFPVRIPAPRASFGGMETRSRTGHSGDFFGLREYREGDDRRDVHWRSSARHGRLLVREYEDEVHRRATLVVDNSLPDGADQAETDELERAVSLVASLAVAYLEHRYAVRLIARGAEVRMGTGPAHKARLLRALALLATVSVDTPFAATPDPRSDVTMVTRKDAPPPRMLAGVTRVVHA